MESIILAVSSFLGGGAFLAVLNHFLGRAKSKVEIVGLKDDQTTHWRDNALHLSDDIIKKDKEVMDTLRKLNVLQIERDALADKLGKCLKKVKECTCHGGE